MKKLLKSKIRFVFIPIVALAFVWLVGYVVMALWNYTLPALFDVKTITLWQAMALFFLCKILFGFGGGGPKKGRAPWKSRAMHGTFDQMGEADKSGFGAYMHWKSCGWNDTSDTPEKKSDH